MFVSAQVDPCKVAVYIRWSTEEQSNGTTLEVQRDACKHYILSQGWQFQEELLFIDDGYSGSNMERPALTRLRSLVQQGDVAGVVVYKLDRLSRNLLDCVTLVRQEWVKVALVSTMEHFDTHSSLGQMVFNMLVSFAEFERNVIRDRTMSGKQKRREQARNSGFPYAYGYRRSADGHFEIDPEKASIVRSIFAQYNAGDGMAGVCDRLNQAGILSPTGKQWRVCSLSLLLKNPIYAGHYAAGYYSALDGYKKRGARPAYLAKHAIPAIITQEEFDQAQQAREERRHPGWPMPKNSDYILSTVLTCGKCGAPMIGHGNIAGRKYYRCAAAKDFGTCENGGIPKADVEATVLANIRRDLAPERIMAHVTYLEELRQREIAERRQRAAGVTARTEEVKRRRESLDADYFDGQLDGKQYGHLAEKLEREHAALMEQLQAAKKVLTDVEKAPVDLDRLAELARQVDGINELSVAQTRQLLRELLSELTAWRVKKRGRHSTEPITVTMIHNVNAVVGI